MITQNQLHVIMIRFNLVLSSVYLISVLCCVLPVAAQNQLSNPGFDRGTGIRDISDWSSTGNVFREYYTLPLSAESQTSYVAKLFGNWTTNPNYSTISQTVPIFYPGDYWEAGLNGYIPAWDWMRGSNEAFVELRFLGADGQNLKIITSDSLFSSDTQNVFHQFWIGDWAPLEATHIQFSAVFEQRDGWWGAIYFEDARLATAFTDDDADGMADVWEYKQIQAHPEAAIDTIEALQPEDDLDIDALLTIDEFLLDTNPFVGGGLVRNPGFETSPARQDWQVASPVWRMSNSSVDRKTGTAGALALVTSQQTPGTYRLSQTIDVRKLNNPDQMYQAFCWQRVGSTSSTGASQSYLDVRFFGAAEVLIDSPVVESAAKTHQAAPLWSFTEAATGGFAIPGNTAYLELSAIVQVDRAPSDGYHYHNFDDFRLVPIWPLKIPADYDALQATLDPDFAEKVHVTWEDIWEGDSGFVIERWTRGILEQTVETTATTYMDSGLSYTTSYTYRIHVKNAAGLSEAFETSVTTDAPLAITGPSALPGGQKNVVYQSYNLQAKGGDGNYSWQALGSLPPGLSLTVAGTLHGTPTQRGDYSLTVQVDDGRDQTVQSSLSLSIDFDPNDMDMDGLPDEWELVYGLDPSHAAGHDGAAGDPDADGLTNLDEWLGRSHPNADADFLDALQRKAFDFFWNEANPDNGLIPDVEGLGNTPIASTSATGFGLAAICIGIEQGWISREVGYERALRTLRFFANGDVDGDGVAEPDYALQAVYGFYYHFIDFSTGARAGECELSSIDTALLLAGVLSAREYFDQADEAELRELANALYARVDWSWMQSASGALSMGWSPEQGFLPYEWDHYSEHTLVYFLAIGAPDLDKRLPASAWHRWSREEPTDYQGKTYLSYPPLFVHQVSHAWLDYSGKSDAYLNYETNAQLGHLAHKDFCLSLAGRDYVNLLGVDHGYDFLYHGDLWGISESYYVKSDGAYGYQAWGGPPALWIDDPLDGTVVPYSVAGSLPYLGEEALSALRFMYQTYGDQIWGEYGFVDSFNPSVMPLRMFPGYVGIHVGLTLLMADNYEHNFTRDLLMRSPEISAAFDAIGFATLNEVSNGGFEALLSHWDQDGAGWSAGKGAYGNARSGQWGAVNVVEPNSPVGERRLSQSFAIEPLNHVYEASVYQRVVVSPQPSGRSVSWLNVEFSDASKTVLSTVLKGPTVDQSEPFRHQVLRFQAPAEAVGLHLSAVVEVVQAADGGTEYHNFDAFRLQRYVDTDADGMPDDWELEYGLDPNDSGDASGDLDADSLSNLSEYKYGSSPLALDGDGDGLSDVLEIEQYGTDPLSSDTDLDGVADAAEIFEAFTDPNHATDFPQGARTFYVSAEGDQSYPFASWEHATHRIEQALQVAQAGDTILVMDGTYYPSDTLLLDRGITLKSVNGAASTMISGSAQHQCVYLDHADAKLEGFTLSHGVAEYGGGIYLHQGGLVVDCIVRDNQATRGGGIFLNQVGGEVMDSIVEANHASWGAGVYLSNGGVVSGSTIRDNQTLSDGEWHEGGGAYVETSGELTDCVIENNNSGKYGGAVVLYHGGLLSLCEIRANRAGIAAGAVYAFKGGTVRNTLIVDNEAPDAAGVRCYYGGVLENCTIAANRAELRGGGVYFYQGGVVRNSIVYYNTAQYGANHYSEIYGDDRFEYSCTIPLASGLGNLSTPPDFSVTAGSYSIMAESSARNAGQQLEWHEGSTDLQGDARVLESAVDIGADEYLDSDGDLLPDSWEWSYGLSPTDSSDAAADKDADGLSNYQEYLLGTDPNAFTDYAAWREQDSDGDGLFNGVESDAGLPVYRFNADSDFDGDGLSDFEEYRYGTNPGVADTDGDGMPDGIEIGEALSDPLVVDFNGESTLIVALDGASTSNLKGSWGFEGGAIYARERNGYLEYEMSVAQAGQYVLEVEATQHNRLTARDRFDLTVLVDGRRAMQKVFTAPYGTVAGVQFFLPELSAGLHTFRLQWNNLYANTFLKVLSVRLVELGGPDLDGNRQADWIDARIANLHQWPEGELVSYVSPLCLEGSDVYPEVLQLSTSYVPPGGTEQVIALQRGIANGWYANVELSAQESTVITLSHPDAAERALSAQWQVLNLFTYTQESLRLRLGDALLLNAYPPEHTDGAVTIQIDETTAYSTTVDQPVAHRFQTPGTYQILATWSLAGTSEQASITVEVIDATFAPAPICILHRTRDWLCPELPAGIPIDYDSRLGLSAEALDPAGLAFTLLSHHTEELRILARISEGGAIADSVAVTTIYGDSGSYWSVVQNYPDGSRMIEVQLSLVNVPVDIRVELTVVTGGVTFADGSLSKILTAADFDEHGVATYRMLQSAGFSSSVCHETQYYQAEESF